MDPLTALAIATLMMLLNGGVLALLYRSFPPALQPSVISWCIGTLLQAAGCVLFAVQRSLPEALAVPLANTLLILGITGYWRALRQFHGSPDTPLLLVPAAIAAVGIYLFTVPWPSVVGRVEVITALWIAIMAGAAKTLRWSDRRSDPVSRNVLASIFVVVSLFMAARGLYFALHAGEIASVIDRSAWINMVTPMILAILPVIGTTGFLLLCSNRIRRDWEHAASTDHLTGLVNRRTLAMRGAGLLRRARQSGQPLTIAVIDIDHFKSINDRHGHDVGDVALKHVATLIVQECRDGDVCARLGGEEFAIALVDVGGVDALARVERMRTAVEAAPLDVAGTRIAVTISIGLSALRQADADLDEVLRRADHALYVAKAGGRNRVEPAD